MKRQTIIVPPFAAADMDSLRALDRGAKARTLHICDASYAIARAAVPVAFVH